MIDQVSDELRNVSITSKITRWLNLAIIEVATNYVFGHLNKYGTKNTVAGDPDVTLDSDFLWLKYIGIPTEQRNLTPEDEAFLASNYPDYRTKQGTIQWYYLNGIKLGLYQVPSGIATLTYAYQKRPLKLAGTDPANEISDLPEEWHNLIAQKAITKGFNYEGNTDGYNKSVAEENRALIRLGTSVYRRIDDPVVMGGSTSRVRIPRPRLPSNFPPIRY